MSGDELRGLLEAMEARLMTRINTNHAAILDRLTVVETDLRNLRTEHATTQTLVAGLPATMLAAIRQPLLDRITAVEGRVTQLEKPKDGE